MTDLIYSFGGLASTHWLTEAAQTQFAQDLLIVLLIWRLMGRRVSGHFASVEASINAVVVELGKLRETVGADLRAQAMRLGMLEKRVDKIENNKPKEIA